MARKGRLTVIAAGDIAGRTDRLYGPTATVATFAVSAGARPLLPPAAKPRFHTPSVSETLVSRRKTMHACTCLATAVLALTWSAPGSSAERSASSSADAQIVHGDCASAARTPEEEAECRVSRWRMNECSGIGDDHDDCIRAERSAVREVRSVHTTFSDYADCVGRGENRIGGWQ